MASESFKAQLNIYVDSLISNTSKEGEIRKELSNPKIPRHDIFVEPPEIKNKSIRSPICGR
jgi:hypothetical protein